jgi:hypothetical protein
MTVTFSMLKGARGDCALVMLVRVRISAKKVGEHFMRGILIVSWREGRD